jgi:hypothetical protein
MQNGNKSIVTGMAIAIKKSSYLPSEKSVFPFAIGDLIKTSLNADNRYDDVCVIEGVRFDRDFDEWFYGLRIIISLSYWFESHKLIYHPNDGVEVPENYLLPLDTSDYQKLQIALNNYQTLRDTQEQLDCLGEQIEER